MTHVCPDMGFLSILFCLQQFCDCWHEFLYLCYCSRNSIAGFSRLLTVASFSHVFNVLTIGGFWDTHERCERVIENRQFPIGFEHPS